MQPTLVTTHTETLLANRYQITTFLAAGGMGAVYRGHDQLTGEAVAIKQLRPEVVTRDPALLTRFTQEGELLRRLNHPNIVRVISAVEENGQSYLIMEYMPASLRDVLRAQPNRQLPIPQVLRVALELSDALARAHHLNILHRDIKPDNVLIAADGTPRLTDFGIALVDTDLHLTPGELSGTPAYLSPEAVRGEPLDERSDLWSFGVLMYEMVTGQTPFGGDHLIGTLNLVLNGQIPELKVLRPDCPTELITLIEALLVKNCALRLESARRLGAELEAIQRIVSGAAAPSTMIVDVERLPLTLTPSLGAVLTPTHRSQPLPVHNLPAQTTPLIGREEELAEVTQLLGDSACRLLTLIGPGGMGKTRLGLAVAEQQIGRWEGVFFIALAPLSQSHLILTALNETLEVPVTRNPRADLLRFIAGRRFLLVMDNFEHLLEGAELVAEMLTAAPNLKIIATSREALNLQAEWLHPVRGLRVPESVDAPDFANYSAIQLFTQGARRVRRDFTPESEKPHLLRITQMVEGMPLGIELAAAWLKRFNTQRIAEEISKNLDFLSTTARNVAERHRSLRAVFDYSWALLDTQEQSTLAALSLFQGGFDEAAARAISGASFDGLTALIDKSLLTVQDVSTEEGAQSFDERYVMHEMVRQYAAERLAERPSEQAALKRAFCDYFATLATTLSTDSRKTDQVTAMRHTEREIGNLRLCYTFAIEQENLLVIRQLTELLFELYRLRLWRNEAVTTFHRAAELCERLPAGRERDVTLGFLLACASWFRTPIDGHPELFGALATRGLALLAPYESQLIREFAIALVYTAIYSSATPSRRHEAIQHGLSYSRKTGQRHVEAAALILSSYVVFDQTVEQLVREGLALAQQIGDQESIADGLRGLARIGLMRLNFQEVVTWMTEGITIDRQLSDNLGLAMNYEMRGTAYMLMGQFTEAEESLRESLRLSKHAGYRWGEVRAMYRLGSLSLIIGAYEIAERFLDDAIARSDRRIETHFHDIIQAERALLEVLRGNPQNALERVRACEKIIESAEGEPDSVVKAFFSAAEGWALLKSDQPDAAISHFRGSLRGGEGEVSDGVRTLNLVGLAWAKTTLGQVSDAVLILHSLLQLPYQGGALVKRLTEEKIQEIGTPFSGTRLSFTELIERYKNEG